MTEIERDGEELPRGCRQESDATRRHKVTRCHASIRHPKIDDLEGSIV